MAKKNLQPLNPCRLGAKAWFSLMDSFPVLWIQSLSSSTLKPLRRGPHPFQRLQRWRPWKQPVWPKESSMREGFPTCEETVMSEKCSCTRISTTLFCCRSVTRDSYLKCGAVEAPWHVHSFGCERSGSLVLQKSGQHTRRGRRAFGVLWFLCFLLFWTPMECQPVSFQSDFLQKWHF